MGAHNVYRLIVHATGEVWIRAYPTAENRSRDSVEVGWVVQDFPSADALEQILPRTGQTVDRSRRHAWRWQGNRVLADPAVPDPPNPKQPLLDEITAATTVAALKTALLKVVKG